MPMVDIAFEILKTTQPAEKPYEFSQLIQEVLKVKQITPDEQQLVNLSVHLFTDLNIDGRFASTIDRTWILRSWQTLNKDIILDIAIEDEDEETEEDGEGATETPGLLGDPKTRSTGSEEEDTFKIEGDPYSDSDDEDDLDGKRTDDEMPEIEGLPEGDGEISIEDLKMEEDRDDDDDDDLDDPDDK